MKNTKFLYALELDIGHEAGEKHYWVIHTEEVFDGQGGRHLCVYDDKEQAEEECKHRDHDARVAVFKRVVPKKRKKRVKK
jgi:hypothetical protein